MRSFSSPLWGLSLITLLSLSGVSEAQQRSRQYTEITGTGQTLYPIAVPPIVDHGGASEAAKIAVAVITRDLTLSGLFKVLNPKGFLADLTAEGTSLKVRPWIDVGAQGVVKAAVRRAGSRFSFNFYLYDTGKGAKPVLNRSYRSAGKSVRRLAHRFANDIVQYFTKEEGIFLTRITFATKHPRARRSQVYVMDYDGYGVYRLSRTGNQNVLPAWSPDGRVAYTSFLWRNPDLYVVDGGGGRARRIAKHPGVNSGAAWSPDGRKIALTLSRDGNLEIYLITPRGKILRRLTRNSAIDTSPTWSPDGARIAFVSNRGGSPQIYIMSAVDGSGVKRLTYSGNYNQEPDWCPRKDCNLIAFTGRDERGSYDIFTIDAGSGETTRLTQGQGSNESPTWSPNGRLIAFASSRGGIWLMTADGLNQHQVYRGGASTPDWSH